MKKFLQAGVSLPEVLIGVGLTGFIGIIVAQLLENQTTASKSAEIKSEYDELITEIRSVLSKPESCEATFANRDVTVPAAGAVPSIKQVFDKTKPPLDKWQPLSATSLGLLKIKGYQFEPSDPSDAAVGMPADSVNGVINLKIFMGFDERKKGGKDAIRRIRLNVETVSIADRRLKTCVADASFSATDTRYLKRTGGVMVGDIIMSEGTQFVFESDRELKENIESLPLVMSDLQKLNPVTYNWGPSKPLTYGFIAQEVAAVYPHVVKKNKKYLTVDYVQFVPLIAAGIQEMHTENQNLKNKIDALKNRHLLLKQKLCEIEPDASICGGKE